MRRDEERRNALGGLVAVVVVAVVIGEDKTRPATLDGVTFRS